MSVSLGSAYFEFVGRSESLIVAGAKAEQAAKANYEAIGKAAGVSAAAVERSAKREAAAAQASSNARAAATLKIIKSHNDAAASAERSAQRQEQASKQTGGGFGEAAKGALAFGVAATGVVAGAVLVHDALAKVSEETRKATQAQFALNATYKGTVGLYNELAVQQAAATKRTTTEFQEAAVAVGSLSNRYAIQSDQIKEIIKRSADLAAVNGITVADAAKRVEASLRGEAEAAEAIGLTLNSDYLKKFAVMSDLQRKNWETLDPLVKAQIAYKEFLRQTDPLVGTAIRRSNEQAGAWDNAATAASNLALVVGKELQPAWISFGGVVEDTLIGLGGLPELIRRSAQALQEAAKRQIAQETGISQPSGVPSRAPAEESGGAPAQSAAAINATIADARKKAEVAAATRRDQNKADLEDAQKSLDKQVDLEIDAIDKERKAKDRWYSEERSRIEARRTYALEDIATRRDAALAALEEEGQAAKDAISAEIEQARYAKQAEIKAAEDKKTQAVVQIDAESDAAKDLYDGLIDGAERARDQEIKSAEDKRDAAINAIEEQKRASQDARREEDRQRQDERQGQDREVAAARKQQDARSEADKTKRTKSLEDEHARAVDGIDRQIQTENARTQQALRGIEQEADARRDANESALRAIDQQRTAEDDRHRKALADLKAEEDQRLAAIDAQLAALDALDQFDANASKDRQLQDAVTNARLGITKAESTGNFSEILKARQELADAEDAIRQESVARDRDAARDTLKAKQDAISAEIQARENAEDEQNRISERSFDQEDQRLKDALTAQLDVLEQRKQAVNDEADNALEKLKQRKDAEDDDYRDDVERINKRYDLAKRRLEENRTDEDNDRKDRREAEDRATEDARLAQDRDLDDRRAAVERELQGERDDIKAHYDGPDGVIPTLKAKSEEIAKEHEVRRQSAERQLGYERDAVEALYDGPDGIITLLQKKSQDIEREYSRRLATARIAFEDERKAAESIYTNPEGNGLLDNLAKAREAENTRLDNSKEAWENWRKSVQESISAAQKDLDSFNGSIQGAGDSPARSSGGSGQNTSSSDARTKSDTSGQKVKGDVGSWLNDAMDITGVPDEWIRGLQELVSKESSGDPHAQNPKTVNGEHATGLMQTLPSTFKAYRNKDLPNDIYDPVANAVASINYIRKTYGSVNDIPGLFSGKFKGYANGGWIARPTVLMDEATGQPYGRMAEAGAERILSNAQSHDWGRGGDGGSIVIDMRGSQYLDERRFKDAVIGALREANADRRISVLPR